MTVRHADVCQRTRALISRSLDHELPELQRSLLDAHTRRCAECAAFAEDVRSITATLRQTPLLELGRSVTPPRRRMRPLRLRVAVHAAALALIVVGVGTAIVPGPRVLRPQGEEGLLAAPLAVSGTEVLSNENSRTLRDDAVRRGAILVLPDAGSDPIGEAKAIVPAVPA